MFRIVLKICKGCNREINDCQHQRQMRAFGFDELMDNTLTKEEVYPPWDSSNGQQIP